MPVEMLTTILASVVAGIVGAMLGIGGGVIIIPFLTLVQGVPIKAAISASIVAVVATSTASAISYVEKGSANIRLGMLLETSTTTGALIGALLATVLSSQALEGIFGAALIYASFATIRGRASGDFKEARNDGALDKLRLSSSYYDESILKTIPYTPRRVKGGLVASLAAGWFAGMLGVGGGFVKVPIMRSLMNVPTKVATATSNFMIGITAATGAMVYLMHGLVDPEIVTPVALGVLVGGVLGSRIAAKLRAAYIRYAFVLLLMYTALRMILGALGISIGL
jgi:hypothetical protein